MTKTQKARWIAEAMRQAEALEGKARERTLTEEDCQRLIDACRKHKGTINDARAYAQNGNFVPGSYRYRAYITVVGLGWFGLPMVWRASAQRPHGKSAGVTVNNRAVA